jgi:hypothetical protein
LGGDIPSVNLQVIKAIEIEVEALKLFSSNYKHSPGKKRCQIQQRVHTSIPSSTSTVVSNEEEDSMDKTPSGPTLPIASAIIVPINSSFPAEIEATADTTSKLISMTLQQLVKMKPNQMFL